MRNCLVSLLMLAVMPPVIDAQSKTPVPPPGAPVIRAALEAVQSGNMSASVSFLRLSFSDAALARDSASLSRLVRLLHEQGAPYRIEKVDSVGRHSFLHMVSDRARRTLTLDLATDRSDSAHLSSVEILESHNTALDVFALRETADTSASVMSATIIEATDHLSTAGALSGVVYVLKGNEPIVASAYGFANLEDSVPNRIHTKFALASMGKMFTAAAILQLAQAGKLRLDDTLGTVLPLYPNVERARQITIRQLLEHTGGTGDIWSTAKRPVAGLTGALAYAASVAYPPLLFTPGTRWSYSNEGYAILAAVIERLSGESFTSYIQRHVLDVAGMNETSLLAAADNVITHRAVGYKPADDDPLGVGPLRANWSFIKDATFGGAGGGYSTVVDIAKFARALREGKLIDRQWLQEMWTGHWPIDGYPDERYGLGSFVMQLGGKTIVGHGGGGTGSGMDNGFRQFTDGSYTVVVLTNGEPPVGTRLTDRIVRFLGGAATVRNPMAH